MKTIPLTKGKEAIVDDEDFEWLSQWKWCTKVSWRGNTEIFYAVRGKGPRKAMKIFKIHRVIMNAKPGQIIDHINGDGLDNRRCNLRFVTASQNSWNTRPGGRGSSRFKGVSWSKPKKKWRAYINLNNRQQHINHCELELQAAFAYNIRAILLFGEYACLNNVWTIRKK